ncbi:MAG: DUF4491 family protein [Coriobacteriia bacterium]|nr:DUF4491 family protein [Coriobacteriia bacterium]
MNIVGIIIGACTFLIIGLCHPLVIKGEYYFGTRIWPLFLIAGLVCIISALFIQQILISALLAVAGFSLLWSIHELFEQKKRVEKGWFPANPNKNSPKK